MAVMIAERVTFMYAKTRPLPAKQPRVEDLLGRRRRADTEHLSVVTVRMTVDPLHS
ncbi:MAG: hypothetical protein U0Q11_23385 [Vicinamibacterales bacterium]